MTITAGTAGSEVPFSNETTHNVTVTAALNDTIIVFAAGNSFTSATTVAINDGSAYTKAVDLAYQSNIARLAIGVLQGVSAGVHTIAVTFSQGVYGGAIAIPFQNCATLNTGLDVPLAVAGSSVSPATGTSATLSSANALILAGFAASGTALTGATTPPNSGYTNVFSDLTATFMPCVFSYKVVSANTAQSADLGTVSPTTPWGAGLVIIPELVASGQGILMPQYRNRLVI